MKYCCPIYIHGFLSSDHHGVAKRRIHIEEVHQNCSCGEPLLVGSLLISFSLYLKRIGNMEVPQTQLCKPVSYLLYCYLLQVPLPLPHRAVSITMVFVNKTLLGGSSANEKDAPLFVTWFQCVVTAVSCLILTSATRFIPKNILSFPEVGRLEATKVKQVGLAIVIQIAIYNSYTFSAWELSSRGWPLQKILLCFLFQYSSILFSHMTNGQHGLRSTPEIFLQGYKFPLRIVKLPFPLLFLIKEMMNFTSMT